MFIVQEAKGIHVHVHKTLPPKAYSITSLWLYVKGSGLASKPIMSLILPEGAGPDDEPLSLSLSCIFSRA